MRKLAILIIPLLTMGLALNAGARKQKGPPLRLVARIDGPNLESWFGHRVVCCDVNRDRKPDIIVAAPKADVKGLDKAGSVYIYSGADGSLLKRLDGAAEGEHFGFSVACCDLDGDRYGDIVVSSPGLGQALIYSGRDWRLMRVVDQRANGFLLGGRIICCDINLDKVPDLIAQAFPIGDSSRSSVLVISGADGSLLHQWDHEPPDEGFGFSLACGDLNRDRFPDVIVGAFLADANGIDRAGSVFAFSGKDGSLLYRWDGAADRDLLGFSVAYCDLNRDRYGDVVTGALGAAPNGVLDAGSVFVFSGKDGSALLQFDGSEVNDRVGHGIVCCRIDKDKTPDIITAGTKDPIQTGDQNLWVISGKDGHIIQRIVNTDDTRRFGAHLACCQKKPGKSKATGLIVGAKGDGEALGRTTGSVYIYSVGKKGIRWGR